MHSSYSRSQFSNLVPQTFRIAEEINKNPPLKPHFLWMMFYNLFQKEIQMRACICNGRMNPTSITNNNDRNYEAVCPFLSFQNSTSHPTNWFAPMQEQAISFIERFSIYTISPIIFHFGVKINLNKEKCIKRQKMQEWRKNFLTKIGLNANYIIQIKYEAYLIFRV